MLKYVSENFDLTKITYFTVFFGPRNFSSGEKLAGTGSSKPGFIFYPFIIPLG